MSRNPAKRACLSTIICRTAVPTGEVHRLPQKSLRFYRRSGAKSRPARAKSCKIAVCAGTSSIYARTEVDIRSSYCKHLLVSILPSALRITDKMPASGKQGPVATKPPRQRHVRPDQHVERRRQRNRPAHRIHHHAGDAIGDLWSPCYRPGFSVNVIYGTTKKTRSRQTGHRRRSGCCGAASAGRARRRR